MKTLLLSGALANKPLHGGEAWVRLSFIRGFQRLGFRVGFVEQIEPATCVDAAGRPAAFEDSVNLAYFRRVVNAFGLGGAAALVFDDGREIVGMDRAALLDLADDAALLVNIGGHLTWAPMISRVRRKAYLDLDPGYTQFWHAAGHPGVRLAGHDLFFTLGERIGAADCPIPTGGVPWRPMRQPVVLGDWPVAEPPADPTWAAARGFRGFTTVASWRGGYGPAEFAGVRYGLKCHEFRKFADLPRRAAFPFEIALDIHPADAKDRELLETHGWRLADPRAAAGDPDAFRAYVAGSAAECSVAQGIYVQTRCGWFSDRTTRYLASGRPALVQDTGFPGAGAGAVPAGAGLLTFTTMEEAAAGAEAIVRDYAAHARAAREVAEKYFDSGRVLGRLLEEARV